MDRISATSLILFCLASLIKESFQTLQGCSTTCNDFHHLCPAVQNHTFLEEYNRDAILGMIRPLGRFDIPVTVDCTDDFWYLRCPQSCGLCVSCGSGAPICDEPQTIKVLESTSDKTKSGYAGIEAASDGFVLTPDSECYWSNEQKLGWAKLSIPMSKVTMVSLAPLFGADVVNYNVRVCSGDSDCIQCGDMSAVDNKYWTHSVCPDGTRGDTVKITQNEKVTSLRLCEVRITGSDVRCSQEDGPVPARIIKIQSSAASRPLDLNETIDLAHDGFSVDTTQCYESRDPNKGWAEFTIPMSEVRKVSVCVKEGKNANHYHIKVCNASENCVECDAMPYNNVNLAWGDSECPEGTTGDTVKIQQDPSADRLQLCEVEITGLDVDEGNITGSAPEKLLPILSAEGDKAQSDSKQLTAAYDGIVDTVSACYVSEDAKKGWALFTIPMSDVTKVSIVSAESSVTDDYHVQVCVGGKDCIECSNFPSVSALVWAHTFCPEGTQGDTIKIYQDYDVSNLRLCEIKITGTETKAGPVSPAVPRLLDIVSSESGGFLSGYKNVSAAHDGYVENSPFTCYYSSDSRRGWAKFKLAKKYRVTKVAVSLETDDYGDNTDVSVCTGDDYCIDCGAMADDHGNYKFTDSECPEGTQGDTIYIKQAYSTYLRLCEVKVTGLDIEEGETTDKGAPYSIEILQSTSYAKRSGYGDVSKAHDGVMGWSSSECYRPNSCYLGWATFYIPMSEVTSVSIAEMHNWYAYHFVQVCTDGLRCVECGFFSSTTAYHWNKNECPEGTRGNEIKISKLYNSRYLSLCEVKISGYELKNDTYSNGLESLRTIISATASAHYSSAYPIADAYDGYHTIDSYCYRSSSTANNYANFTIPMSTVTKVSLASYSNYYSEYYYLMVCGDESCTLCDYFPSVISHNWATVQCPEGTRGNVASITSLWRRLGICEIKIYGFDVDNSTTGRGAASSLSVISASAYDYQQQPISKAIDGVLTISYSECYSSRDDNKGWAHFRINMSEVSKVTVASSRGADADDYDVKVCTGDKDCVECSRMPAVSDLFWADSVCPEGTIGDIVKINELPSASYLELCEVIISGWDAESAVIEGRGPAKLLEIIDATGDGPKDQSYDVGDTYDGILETTTQCYTSKDKVGGWIEYKIETSEVLKVALTSSIGSYMDDYYVTVCKGQSSCVDCSYLGAVEDLAWAESTCPEGTIGDTIKLSQNPTADHLRICEVKITGFKGVTSNADGIVPPILLEIESAEAADYKHGHEKIDHAYDGIINEAADCYVSNDADYGWADFKIKMSEVTKVAVSSIEGQYTDEYKVDVCTGDDDCFHCLNMPAVNNFQWAESECPEGTKGDTVKFTQDISASHLQICEVKVTGRESAGA